MTTERTHRTPRCRTSASLLALALCTSMLPACKTGGLARRAARSPELSEVGLQQGTTDRLCLDGNRPTKPMVVDWTSSDRAALESAVTKGLVVMKYTGCNLEIVPGCTAPGQYGFSGVTPKKDRARIDNRDSLYAHVPTSAAQLEARLKRWGQLNVEMTILGRYEASRGGVRTNELQGSCLGATHVARAVVAGDRKSVV